MSAPACSGSLIEDLSRGLHDHACVDVTLAPAVGAQQGPVGEQVDAPRHAARQPVQAAQRRRVEGHRDMRPRHRESVLHVLARLGAAQRPQVVARDDALRQLLQPGLGQPVAQFGLADEDDLQQLALGGFEVREQAQLLEHRGLQGLRLVDHEQRMAALGVGLEQEAVERVDMRLDAGAGGQRFDAELAAHGLQQLDHAQAGVEDVGHHAVRRQLLQEAAHDGCLAGTDLARQQHEATAAAHAIQQVRQRLAVALAHEQKTGVGGEREGLAAQAEERRVHGARIAARRHRPPHARAM